MRGYFFLTKHKINAGRGSSNRETYMSKNKRWDGMKPSGKKSDTTSECSKIVSMVFKPLKSLK